MHGARVPTPSPPPIVTGDSGDVRELLWQMGPSPGSSGNVVTRFYRHLTGLEVTVNALWENGIWNKDGGSAASRLVIKATGTVMSFHTSGATTFSDAGWTGSFSVSPNTSATALITSSAELQGPGQTESYIAQQCRTSTSGNKNIGSSCTFRKRFPATPSSVTITTLASSGINSGPTAFLTRAYGTGAYAGTTGSGGTAYFYARVLAS